MARTQLNKYGIKDHSITGASFVTEMGIWDEMSSYSIGDLVYWNARTYICTAATTGTTEGIITNNPTSATGSWNEHVAGVASNTYAQCTNNTQQTFNSTEVKIALNNIVNSTEVTISAANDQVTFNTAGRYRVDYKVALKGSSNTRCSSTVYTKHNNVLVANTRTYNYVRNSNQGYASHVLSFTAEFASGDTLAFFADNFTANSNINVLSGESFFQFEYVANA